MAGPAVPRAPEVAVVEPADIRAALVAGWADFRAAPLWGLFFGTVFAAGGLLMAAILWLWDMPWALVPLAVGFPLVGPFVATGFYEISRRREAGRPLAFGEILGVVLRQKDRQIPSLAAVIVGLFLAWLFVAHTIFALFLGLNPASQYPTMADMLLSPNGVMMLAFGTAVGAFLAFVLFGCTAIALPLLLDREVDFVTAMITSFGVIRASPGPMLGWGMLIALLTFLAMLPAFLGLLLVMPLLGHASWHLYRRAVLPA
jgi:uncharacterized membrane protein